MSEKIKDDFSEGRGTIMHKLPISDYMRDYYKEQGITFADSEQAAIFWSSELQRKEKFEALLEIADRTADEALREQIRKQLDVEMETERLFRENDGTYFFICVPDDEDEWSRDYFIGLEAAVAYGMENCWERFEICKETFLDKPGEGGEDEDCKSAVVGGSASYKKDGTLLDCWTFGGSEIRKGLKNNLEDTFIPLKNPFEMGDIVRVVGDDRPAIMLVSQENWNRLLERCISEAGGSSYGDSFVRVEFLDNKTGIMYHDHPSFLSLEKINEWEDELEWDLLQMASGLARDGGFYLEDFLYCYHRNLDRRKKQESE